MRNKLFILMLSAASMLCVTSCSSEEEISVPQEVEFTVDYSFAESGSMTRASGSEVFNTFFEKYIKTKKLTPKTYSLTFKHKTTGATTTINSGHWDNKDAIRLIEGEYEVTSTSAPIPNEGDNLSHYVSDTVFIAFDETVSITKDMKSISLTAKYDSYLLIFDKQNNSEASYRCYSSGRNLKKDLLNIDTNFIIFIKGYPVIGGNYNSILLTRNDKSTVKIELEKLPFEKGKYYYFNDMANSFDLPKMESGN